MAPRLSIQVVTWNSADFIDACLQALLDQDSAEAEVLVVDNASSDGSAERVEGWLSRGLRGSLIREAANRGFCGGQNRAFESAKGEWILFLNPDATLPADFVRRALAAADAQPADVGTVAPCILLPDGRVDSTGLVLDRFRRLYDRGRGEASAERYAVEEDVLGCTGAVALHRRTMLLDLSTGHGPLDERLFAYYDDLDLSWRARLRGWRCRYVPSLVATHRRAGRNALRGFRGASGRSAEQALMIRNRYLVMAKCETVKEVIRDLPWLVPFEIGRLLFLAVRSPRALAGYAQAARALPAVLRERRSRRRDAGPRPEARRP
jgi:GT2 family glycosyltransferase